MVLIQKYFTRIFIILRGASLFSLIIMLTDYIFYPFVIYTTGLLDGFLIMLFLSFVFNVILIQVYNHFKKDIFSLEYTKQILDDFVDNTHGNWLHRTLRSVLIRSRIVFFIFLSVYDPFIATVYMRKTYHYHKMTTRDWSILTISVVIGNGIWAPTVFAGISITEFVFNVITK